ncbi:MAG TPA: exodeoxyribonuclease VII large subunit [Parachlamydiaceae bacterium]|nr:exodeoxyribonuclease VII large subunit [Parachlamydiaceae bacterium]
MFAPKSFFELNIYMESEEQNTLVLTVTQLTHAIKHCLEGTFPSLWLEGEISNFKTQTSGHLYFTLKDANAQISAVMFRGKAVQLKNLPKDGDQVIIQGNLDVYPPSGKYQVIVTELKQKGLGELLLKLEELKQKIAKKGWFRKEHKKPLPKFPKKIGVVTSATGAVIQDILNVLSRRFSGFELLLNPVKVQGESAAEEIALAIKQFNDYKLADVLIVGRGGGSIEDLFAFNEEVVAEAIFMSQIPIISAVGHETDHCIADYVADVRAPTPSAAAEIVIAEKAQLLDQLQQIDLRLKHSLSYLIREKRAALNGAIRWPFMASPYALLGTPLQKLDEMRQKLDFSMKSAFAHFKLKLEGKEKALHALNPALKIDFFKAHFISFQKRLDISMLGKLNSLKNEKLLPTAEILKALNPENLLAKGYSILFSEKDHSVITSVHAVEKNQDMRLLLKDGQIVSTVKKIIAK